MADFNVDFTVILGTCNRSEYIGSCVESLLQQRYLPMEILVMDQSDDNKTENIIAGYNSELLHYVKLDKKGLSNARNRGLEKARGNYVLLADDDAFYEADFLEKAAGYIQDDKQILSGYIWETLEERDFAPYDNRLDKKQLSLKMILTTCPSAALVLPVKLLRECGGFDEKLGVGARFGACEETDVLLYGVSCGYQVRYMQSLKMLHPYPVELARKKLENQNEEDRIKKLRSYSCGLGALYKKHMILGKNYRLLPYFADKRLKLLIKSLLPGRFNSAEVKALIEGFDEGFREYKSEMDIH